MRIPETGHAGSPVRALAAVLLVCFAMLTVGCASGSTSSGISSPGQTTPTPTPAPTSPTRPVAAVPRPRHIVVVMLENHSYSEIIGNPQAPFINQLARQGALFTASHAITHPSEPNYVALLSGSTQGVIGDPCPVTLSAPNLATDLIAAHLSFAGYAEGLPATGSRACYQGSYARKHAPWTNFTNVPPSVSLPFSRFPAGRFDSLPTVSFVIPDLCNDMHDCSVATGDSWLSKNVAAYARWAMTHDSLLIVTFDEDDGGPNQIATIFLGQQVRPGHYARPIDHYSVLRTIEQAYGLPHDGQAATHAPITWIWR